MRVNTKVVWEIETGKILRREWQEYSGPVARCTNVTAPVPLTTPGAHWVEVRTVGTPGVGGVDLMGGGHGAILDELYGDVPPFQHPPRGAMGTQRLPDGTDIGAYFAPTNWDDPWFEFPSATPAAAPVSIYPVLWRRAIASRQREPGEGLLLKQIFPPPPPPASIFSRQLRMAIAPQKREAGRGLTLKQIFPPPPPSQNIFTRFLRRAVREQRRPTTKVRAAWRMRLAPPPSQNIFTRFLRRAVGGRRSRTHRYGIGAWRMLRAPAPAVSGLLKRMAGWFRPFWKI